MTARIKTKSPPWIKTKKGILVISSIVVMLILVVLLAVLIPLTRGHRSPGPTVDLGYSTYRGVRLSTGVDQFLGMRYAEPPLGELRFRAPRDPAKTEEIQDASNFGPICVGADQVVSEEVTEDCLFINVFTPSNATSDSDLPVWVYIQGGGYAVNSNANFNGNNVVPASEYGIVLVNFNYRVGALGFLASEKVRQNGDLNVGLLDQRKALQWVQKNIQKFGGNPNHVIIHGASAGAGSVAYHLTAYGGRDDGLFIGAVPESSFWPTQRTVAEMEFQFDRVVERLGCASESVDSLACLRSVNITSFQAANTATPFPGASDSPLARRFFLPVRDGDLIRDRLATLFEQGRFIRVPLMVGGDTNEGSYFAYDATTAAEVAQFFKNNYPFLNASDLQSINREYPKQDPLPMHAAYFPSASAAYGDSTFTCPGNLMADTMAQYYSSDKVWTYRFNVQDPNLVANGYGVPHMLETEAIFGVGYGGEHHAIFSGTDASIVPITMHYYISFVKTLDPNLLRVADAPYWRPWGEGEREWLILQTNATRIEKVDEDLVHKCAFWKGLGAHMEI